LTPARESGTLRAVLRSGGNMQRNKLWRGLAILGGALWCAVGLSACANKSGDERNPMITIKTNHGEIQAELYADKAPESVQNFLQYAQDGHYNGTIFHRVISGFMIQGGGFTRDFQQKATRAPIRNEAANGLKNERGTLAMARTSDIHSATSQFFINTVDNGFLDHRNNSAQGFGYCVFGKVTKGLDVVDKIGAVPTGNHGSFQDVPTTPVEILAVTVQ
jgi:cyclophilin family peptidyl-prolyl cis-trans isomerase